jgi:SNF2 family DNA or RNA helicase
MSFSSSKRLTQKRRCVVIVGLVSVFGLTRTQTLLVSQWTGCLSLISDYLAENGIPHVKYQGDMTRTKRDQAVKVFMAKEKARVMLMSLKCGGPS